MEATPSLDQDQPKWREERLRYDVLRRIHEHSAADAAAVHAIQIQSECTIPFEQLCRVIVFLADHGYVDYLGAGPSVFITSKGIEYLESARRRRSVRA